MRKSPAGVATNDLVFSATVGTNADVFPKSLPCMSLLAPLSRT